MKRMLFVFTLVAALTVPGIALSSSESTESYSAGGSGKRAFESINFTVFLTQNGKPVRVGRFKYKNADATCTTGGPLLLSDKGFGTESSGPNAAAKVENDKFRKRYDAESEGGGEGSFKIKGEFKQHNTKVVGSFRVKGDFPESSASDCDTGREEYKALETR